MRLVHSRGGRAESRFTVDPPCLISMMALSHFRVYQSSPSLVDEVTEPQMKLRMQGWTIPKQGRPTFASLRCVADRVSVYCNGGMDGCICIMRFKESPPTPVERKNHQQHHSSQPSQAPYSSSAHRARSISSHLILSRSATAAAATSSTPTHPTMDAYSYSQPTSPSYFQSLPVVLPLDQDSEVPLYFRDRLNTMSGYQDFDLFSAAYPDNNNHHHNTIQPLMQIETNFGKMQQPTSASQMLNQSPTFPSASSSPVTPTLLSDSDSQGESDGSQSYSADPTMPKHATQSVKRRMQNRQAQRRFRERKEERQQSLEQKAVNLEKQHKELSEDFRQKCEEASQLLREKEGLKGEIEDLRKRWRLMVGLLQRPNGAQSLATLLAGDSLGLSAGSGSLTPESAAAPAAAAAAAPAPAPLDELLGCLHALVVPTQSSSTPHNPSQR
ncbi:hypothetical protein BJY00DRAFT_204521 [Aspergillus carlsbadensis]|nr:hypothetical protein BJY00DRAFT_204521 [Aspergillus carlsbadensis]